MNIRLTRLTVLIMALVTSTGFLMLYQYLTDDLEDQTFQATEESLLDTAHILAGLLEAEIQQNSIKTDKLDTSLKLAYSHKFKATIFNLVKTKVGTNIYVTDDKGIVIYDSKSHLTGKDMAQYNDVYNARLGKYALRSSRDNEHDASSSVLYIGVPISHQSKILGTLTVYKAQTWIFRPIGKLTDYAQAITRGERPLSPKLGRGREVNTLGNALKEMRSSLDGKSYVENYTQILTHELKSPLAAIRGSSELLLEDMPAEQRKKFLINIRNETNRSQRIIDGLLKLSHLEAQSQLLKQGECNLLALASELKENHLNRLEPKGLSLEIRIAADVTLTGDQNLLLTALANLLENSIHFSPEQGMIKLKAAHLDDQVSITLTDQGPGIPDYALPKIFDRFYSIGKPNTSQKSSGLGLSFTKEVIELHHGSIQIENLAHPLTGTKTTITL